MRGESMIYEELIRKKNLKLNEAIKLGCDFSN